MQGLAAQHTAAAGGGVAHCQLWYALCAQGLHVGTGGGHALQHGGAQGVGGLAYQRCGGMQALGAQHVGQHGGRCGVAPVHVACTLKRLQCLQLARGLSLRHGGEGQRGGA